MSRKALHATTFLVLLSVSYLLLVKSEETRSLNRRGDQEPPTEVPPRIIASLSASTHIQVIRSKAKSADGFEQALPSQVFTSLANITVGQDSFYLEWNLHVDNQEDRISRRRRKRRHETSVPASKQWTFEWSVTAREIGKYQAKGYRIREELTVLKNKTYRYSISGLKSATAYQLCLSSTSFPIVDEVLDFVTSQGLEPCQEKASKYVLCKELLTATEKAKPIRASSSRISKEVAIATAVSSASTLVIVVLCCCCCPSKKKRRESDSKEQPEAAGYSRFSKVSASSSSEATSCSVNGSTESSTVCYRPRTRDAGKEDYYINPREIQSINGKNLRVFVRESRRFYIPRKWSTQSAQRNNIIKRPTSWPHFLADEKPDFHLQNALVKSASSASIL